MSSNTNFRRDKALGKGDICGALCESELGKCTLMNRKYPGGECLDPSRMLQLMTSHTPFQNLEIIVIRKGGREEIHTELFYYCYLLNHIGRAQLQNLSLATERLAILL